MIIDSQYHDYKISYYEHGNVWTGYIDLLDYFSMDSPKTIRIFDRVYKAEPTEEIILRDYMNHLMEAFDEV